MMPTPKHKVLILLLLAPVATYVAYVTLLFTLIHLSISIGQALAPGISKDKFLEVKPGMSIEDVINKLGHPVYRYKGLFRGSYETMDEDPYTVLVYAEPGFIGGLEVNVILENDVVVSTAVEYWDLGVYRCDQNYLCDYWSDEMAVHIGELDKDYWWSIRSNK